MGGKAKLLDPASLEQVFSTAVNFKRDSEDITKDIRIKINQLTEPTFLDGMKGVQGEACIEAIQNGAAALEELLELVAVTANFIESKLAEAIRPEIDKFDNKDKQGRSKRIGNRLSLKR